MNTKKDNNMNIFEELNSYPERFMHRDGSPIVKGWSNGYASMKGETRMMVAVKFTVGGRDAYRPQTFGLDGFFDENGGAIQSHRDIVRR